MSYHGLPCACELVNLGREHRSISIRDIHKFWKKLSVNGNDGSNHGVDYKPAMELYIKRFASSSEDQQRNLVMKLLEIADPQTTTLKPPNMEVQGRGRPNGSSNKNPPKKDWSTKRNPSEFEYVAENPEFNKLMTKRKVVSVITVNDYKNWIPEPLMPYIIGVQDPKPDGNCGFRALCMALGKNERVWSWMRRELLDELQLYDKEYKEIFGDEDVKLLWNHLTHFKGSVPASEWMDMLSTGYLFASRFNVVLVQISKPSCYTFLPLRTSVTPEAVMVLGLSLINENHYLKLDLQENCPIPEPVEFWKRFHYPMAMSWRTLLEPRINAFRSLNVQGITQRETFEGAPLFVG